MKKKKRALKITGIVLGSLIILIAVFLGWFITKSWPQTNGELKVPGLKNTVTVIRDKWGVPNIYAENDYDLFFAQGYVTAQDRLFQMEMHRRIGNGTLSEIAGRGGLGNDQMSRMFGLRRIAEKSYPQLDDDTKALLRAYSDGVNAYIKTHQNKLPVEYGVLNCKPEPWTALDTMSFSNFMALINGLNWNYELNNAQITAKLGEKMAADELPPWDPDNPEIITKDLEQYSWRKYLAPLTTQNDIQRLFHDNYRAGKNDWLKYNSITGIRNANDFLTNVFQFGWASGTWAISGKYTATGKPILACDVHMATYIPSFWYEIGLHGGRFDMSGFSLPGAPFILLGRNTNIAWGFVNLNPDVQDFYVETLDNPQNPAKYLYQGQWYDLEKKQEVIKIKGKAPLVLNLLFTRHGPIMNDWLSIDKEALDYVKDMKKYAGRWSPLQWSKWGSSEPIALRWAVQDGCYALKAISLLNRASNWDEFRNALSVWDSLGESFIYADNQGNIGYQAAAKIPIRSPKHLGVLPVSGSSGEYEWKGYIPFEHLPYLYNPPTGYVAAINNKTTTDAYPYKFTYDWFHPGYRARSLVNNLNAMIAKGKPITVEDMNALQGDNFSYAAEQLNVYLAALQPENLLEAKALSYVKKWDARFDKNSIGASIYSTWQTYMDTNTYGDEQIKYQIWGHQFPLKHIESLLNIMKDPTNKWFDNVFTANTVETRDDIVKTSFKNTIEFLKENYGSDSKDWSLSRVQKVRLAHPLFGEAPVIGPIFKSRQNLPFAGSPTSIAFAYCNTFPPRKYNVTFAATQRDIISFGGPDEMLSVVTGGSSMQLFHPHREDQMKLWADMEYHPMPFSKDAISKAAVDKLTLTPEVDH